MILSMRSQAMVFLTASAVGFAIGFIYDVFRIIRKAFKHKKILTQIEDAVFWINVSLLMFYVMLQRNFAQIRAFNVLGTALGMLLYFLTVGRVVVAASQAVIDFIRGVWSSIMYVIKIPLKSLKKLLQNVKKHAIIKETINSKENDTVCQQTNVRSGEV